MVDELNRIRSFNRFYTQKIGLITNRFLKSEYSLVQARILFELNQRKTLYASDLVRDLGLSPDYLSKTMSRFEALGLVVKTPSSEDSRKVSIALTQKGRKAYDGLRSASDDHMAALVKDLTPAAKKKLLASMETIRAVLGTTEPGDTLLVLRSHKPGDMGYVIHRHGVLYAREYGFNHEFDSYVAKGMASFIDGFNPRKEHLWIAETDRGFSGSVAAVQKDNETAQLRWLIVEPRERGRGIGRRLVNEVVQFSRNAGYQRIILWTIDFLSGARHLYDAAGFHLNETRKSRVWGRTLNEEKWELAL